MPFIGNQPALSYTSFAVQHFTTSATTSYTLDYSVANENEIRLVINNVVQQPGSSYAYTASGTSLTLSAAMTSMISTVELCVRNFVDHGYDREKSVFITGVAIFLFGLPSAIMWIKLDSSGVAFPEFLEVQDHIWGYGLMFSGLFIAFSIWKYGYLKWKSQVEEGTAAPGFSGYLGIGVSAFRDDFINTGDNDLEVGRWWDILIYIAFPILFAVLMVSYFADMIANTENVWDPSNPKGVTIILLFWGVVAGLFMWFNRYLVQRLSLIHI